MLSKDIIYQIFLLCAAVCKSWRKLALNTRSLWTNICFSKDYETDLARCELYLARSQDSLLQFAWSDRFLSRRNDFNVDNVLQRLQQLIPRNRKSGCR